MSEATHQIQIGESAPDGDTGARLFNLAVASITQPIQVAHGLGRVPIKAEVCESVGKFFACRVTYKDRDMIHLLFNDAGGSALVRVA